MSSKIEKDKIKQLQDKCQSILNDLLRDEDNKYCVDCDSKGPRWASWNIGVFLCIRCAGIHRNLGVHISKVKSVNLDTWTPEQVVSLQQMGNSRARAVYEANLPDNFRRPQNDSSLESFIRAKYEHKKYIAREWVPPQLPKVNWEKEIEEELEKQKRKKKNNLADSDKKTLVNSVDVPQIPKPKNPSPKPHRNSTPEKKKKEIRDSDLLGLQNSEDNFSSFLSATSEKKSETTVATKSEEESFFNQTVPVEKEKVKLTKDSILALYGSGPQQNVQTNQFNQYQMSQIYQPGNFPASFSAFQQPTQFQQQFNNAGWQPPQQHQQWTKNSQLQTHFSQQQQQQQYISPNSALMPNYGQFSQHQQQQQQFNQTPNPFYVNQGNLQQQFDNLSINNTNTSSLATNIWQ